MRFILPPIVGIVTFVVLWQIGIWIWKPPAFLIPSPLLVLQAAVEKAYVLLTAVRLTASAALCGLLGSVCVGILLAVVLSQSVAIERGFYPYAIFLQTVPVVAISPILILIAGHGFHTIVLISALIGLFPILASTLVGLRAVHPSLLDLFRLHRASRWQELWKLRLPNAVPYLMTGVRTSSGLAILGAIVGESFTQYGSEEVGLGFLTVTAFHQQRTALLYATALASSALGVVFFGLVNLFERMVLRRWSPAE